MLDIKDSNHRPRIEELGDYIENPLFHEFYQYMLDEYKALTKIEFSKDVYFPGWNIKLRKGGKGLCVIYPNKKFFKVLVVVGKKEKEKIEEILPSLSEEMQEIYQNTKEGNGQRWLMIDIKEDNELYKDLLKLIRIRREANKDFQILN
ncbi:MAG: DUF3788 family protein [Gallicola sp.]|nr:DUF3788 family protein [Gallicola sp.]